MQVGIVGLGRIGAGMARAWRAAATRSWLEPDRVGGHRPRGRGRERRAGHRRRPRSRTSCRRISPPRHVLLSLPAGDATQELIDRLCAARSRRHDRRHREREPATARRRAGSAEQGLDFLDMGVSGGGTEVCPAPWSAGANSLRAPRASGRHSRPAGWLSLLRAGRRRPLREDGPQRDRVRPDGGVRRRVRHPPRLRLRARPGGHCPPVESRQRDPLLAPRACRPCSRRRGMTSMASPDGSPILERDGGPSPTPRSTTSRTDHHPGPHPAPPQPSLAGQLHRPSPRGSAQRIRGPCREVRRPGGRGRRAGWACLSHGARADGRHHDDGNPSARASAKSGCPSQRDGHLRGHR